MEQALLEAKKAEEDRIEAERLAKRDAEEAERLAKEAMEKAEAERALQEQNELDSKLRSKQENIARLVE